MLTGREAELARVGEALAGGLPVLVTGEPGAGKTTLLRTAAARTGCRVLEGGALSTLSWMEHLPLTRALGRDLLGSDQQAVEAEVADAVGDGLLLLDDLQWADPRTLAVVAALAGRIALAAGARTGGAGGDPALAALASAGFVSIPLAPLDRSTSASVARSFRPELSAAEADAVVRRAGGNPLLLRELAVTGDASRSLRHTVRARLRGLGPEDRDAFALLALAARPLERELLGGSAAALEGAGLIDTEGAGRVEARHALLAEAAVADLTDDRRRELHRTLAELLPDPGEAARHLALAGHPEECRLLALQAADRSARPGERAEHLRLAAMTSAGPDADDLRLRAAEALEAAYDWGGVFSVLDQVQGTSPEVVARASLIRARAAWGSARIEELRPALDAGLAAADSGGVADLGTLLRIEACRVPLFVDGDAATAAEQARVAHELAVRTGVGIARADYFLGTALGVLDRPGAVEHLEAAIAGARAGGEVGTELTAANNLIAFHESSGSPGLGSDLAHEMAERCRTLGLGYWEANFAYQALQLDFHAGRYDSLVEACERLTTRPLDPRTRDALLEVLAMALVDTGRPDEGARVARDARATAADDHVGSCQFLWVLAEAALWSGDPRHALAHADHFLEELPSGNPNLLMGVVTRAWALFELGEDPGPPPEPSDRPFFLAVPHELAGLRLAYQGHHAEAVAELRAAASMWAPYHRRGELRCEWVAAEVLRRAGSVGEAVTALTMVEKRSAELGLVAVLNRTQRSLRAAGERRAAVRSKAVAGPSSREREVLRLVASGLTNEQIAARLGISRHTVVAQIASAATKLGAANRAQAAALASRLGQSDEPHGGG